MASPYHGFPAGCVQNGILHILLILNSAQFGLCKLITIFQESHHNRLQEVDESTEASSFFHQGAPYCLLLCLLHQQVHIIDILHGAVQLRLQVSTAFTEGQSTRRQTEDRWKGVQKMEGRQ